MSQSLRQNYLAPAVLEELGSMHLRARALVEGTIAGLHRSPFMGGSVEFAEYLEYRPGHELRHVDWKVYAKSDRYYVKQFEDETNLRVYLVMDGSGSMNFQSEGAPLTKLRYAAFVAATLAWLVVRQGDAVGALSFDEATRDFLPAASRTSHLDDVLHLLENLRGAGTTSLLEALRTIAERAGRRSLILIFSDFLDATDETMSFVRVLRQRRHDVALFHAVDPAEMDLPYEGLSLFEGLEGEGTLLVDPDDLRHRYVEAFRAHVQGLEDFAQQADIPYVRFLTTQPVELTCQAFLRGRA